MANCVDDEIVKSTEMNNFFEFNDDNQVEDESNFVSHKVNFVVLTNQLDEHDKCETLSWFLGKQLWKMLITLLGHSPFC